MDITTLPVISTLFDLTSRGLLGLTSLLTPWTGAFAGALAIVLVTLVVRAALIPAGIAQAKADQARIRLAPRLRELQTRYRGDRERLQRETMELYRSENVSPFASCLPILIQAPIVGLLYSVFIHPNLAGHTNELLSQTLLGVPLGTSLLHAATTGTADPAAWLVIGCLVLAIAAVGEITRRAFRITPVEGVPGVPVAMLGALQFMTAVVAVFVPLAAGIYLLTTVTWTLGQRVVLRRVYG
ncbi:membrane protein insertase YidC [Microbacterium sp. 77mftsu3.1]|uniref:YidC/Oxa1 family membrane protein insertase n=1 Tax=Microbacterium sp. 77mftsu3.1 TaxID=1761802 RepID=UPI0004766A7A|nr:membrane protein insertase YidC [Microbacterium sp. 77mftsu3.1]SDG32162.1 YidC/Oxa1 family membrane protein insertase [Microbacterium sp. 77mftsu3.1]